MRSPLSWNIRAACCGLMLGCSSIVLAQANRPATPATTQPAVVSVDAFAPDDSKVPPDVAAKFKAKLITFNVTNMPAMTALEQLTKETGYKIKPAYDGWIRGKGTNVTVSETNQPFWVVFRDICTRGNFTVYYNGGGEDDHVIKIAPGNYSGPAGMRGPVSIKGVFLGVPSYLERENTVNMSTPATVNRNIHIQMQMYFEPSVIISQMSYEPVVDEAIDDNGNSMTPPAKPDEQQNMQQTRGSGAYARLTMPYPTTNPGHRIVKIKGHIPARVQTSSGTMEIPDPLKAAESTQTVGGKTVTFNSLKKQGDRYVLKVTLHRGDEPQNEFYRGFNGPSVRAHLTTAQGNEANYYFSGSSGTADTLEVSLTFNPFPGDPTKLVVEVPTGMQTIGVPFELDNLPLP